MLITNRGIIIRQVVGAISIQSRMATGVRVQRLDTEDAIAAVALVPPAPEESSAAEENGAAEAGDADGEEISLDANVGDIQADAAEVGDAGEEASLAADDESVAETNNVGGPNDAWEAEAEANASEPNTIGDVEANLESDDAGNAESDIGESDVISDVD